MREQSYKERISAKCFEDVLNCSHSTFFIDKTTLHRFNIAKESSGQKLRTWLTKQVIKCCFVKLQVQRRWKVYVSKSCPEQQSLWIRRTEHKEQKQAKNHVHTYTHTYRNHYCTLLQRTCRVATISIVTFRKVEEAARIETAIVASTDEVALAIGVGVTICLKVR